MPHIKKNKYISATNIKIFFLIVFIVIFVIFIKNNFHKTNYEDIFEYVGKVIQKKDSTFNKNISKSNFDFVYVTLYYDHALKGCVSAKNTSNLLINNLKNDLKKATNYSLNDHRYKNFKVDVSKIDNFDIVISFVSRYKEFNFKNIEDIKNKIQLGKYSVKLIANNKESFYLAYFIADSRWDHLKLLEKLCQKSKQDKRCYLNNSRIVLYKTESYYQNENKEVVKLEGSSYYFDKKRLNASYIKQTIKDAIKWIENTKNINHLVYIPNISSLKKNKYISNSPREMMGIWIYLKTCNMYGSFCREKNEVVNILKNYINKMTLFNDKSFYKINAESEIGFNSLMLLAIYESNVQNKRILITQIANYIIDFQGKDGLIYTNTLKTKSDSTQIYPGIAFLSLVYAYKETDDARYLNSSVKIFNYYNEFWRSNKFFFTSWISQALTEMYKITKDKQVAQLAVDMNIYNLKNYQFISEDFLDPLQGGIVKADPSFHTSVILEGAVDAYFLSKEINISNEGIIFLRKSIIDGTRYVMQTRIDINNSFHIKNLKNYFGAFSYSYKNNMVRIDFVAHALNFLPKLIEYEIL